MFEQRATRWAFPDSRRKIQRRSKNITGKFLIVMTLLVVCRAAQGQCAGQWAEGLSTLSGIDGFVYAITVFNDGRGDALYVGGSFSIAGDTVAANIANANVRIMVLLPSSVGWARTHHTDVLVLTHR